MLIVVFIRLLLGSISGVLLNTADSPLVVRDRILNMWVVVRYDLKRLCAGIAAVHITLVAIDVEHAVTFKCQLQTTLVKHYVQRVVVAVHFTGFEHSFCRNTRTCTEHVDICQRFGVFRCGHKPQHGSESAPPNGRAPVN